VAERALITGGAGFLGLHLAQALIARGWEVTLVDNFVRGRRDAALESLVARPEVSLEALDLTRPVPARALSNGYRAVFHLAARVGVEQAQTCSYAVLRDNVLAAVHLLDACRRLDGAVLCFASTSEVYADALAQGLAGFPTAEDAPLVLPDAAVPRSSYAVSKMAGEHLFAHHARACGQRLRVVRLHNVYGPRMGESHVVPQFIRRALAGADPFAVYGDQQRAFCFIRDAVEAILALAALDQPGPLTVNVGDDREEVNMSELARRVTRLAGYSPQLEVRNAPPGSPARRLPDLARLRRLTGFRPCVTLDEGLEQTFAWYRDSTA
jgi:UDP-glucose 4-epimerase/UDP-glucuronate decarboxylase